MASAFDGLQCFDVADLKESPELADVCSSVGAFRVNGHGIPEPVIDAAARAFRSFLLLSEDERLRVRQRSWDVVGGYIPFRSEGRPEDVRRDDAHLKRSFSATHGDFEEPPTRPEIWPASPAGFRDAIREVFSGFARAATRVRRAVAASVLSDADCFERAFEKHESMIKLIHYPVLPPSDPMLKRALRAGAHQDFEFLTLLWMEDREGGLQVRAGEDRWIDVPARPGELVVILGDLLELWTDRRTRSAWHRVVNPPEETPPELDRVSFAFFSQPDSSATVRGVLAGDYLQGRLTYG